MVLLLVENACKYKSFRVPVASYQALVTGDW